jgi:hypothetical protein
LESGYAETKIGTATVAYFPFFCSAIQSTQQEVLYSIDCLIRVIIRPYGREDNSMFDSLADRIKYDEHQEVNATERFLRLAAIVVLSILLFGGLFLGVKFLE